MASTRTARRKVQGTQAGLPPATLGAYLNTLAPAHWWKLDEASGSTFADSGTSPLALTLAGSAPLYQQSGPSSDTFAVDMSTSNTNRIARTTTTISTATKGSVIIFFRHLTGNWAGATDIALATDNGAFANGLGFGVGALGLGGIPPAGRVTVRFSTSNVDRVTFSSSTDSLPASGDTAWHSFVVTADGLVAPKLYLDGVLLTASKLTNGTAPADTTWFGSYAGANAQNGTVIGNEFSANTASNSASLLSNIMILDNTVLTQADVTLLDSYVV